MLPIKGRLPVLTVSLESEGEEQLEVELRISSKPFNHTPDSTLEKQLLYLHKGRNEVGAFFQCVDRRTAICFYLLPEERAGIHTEQPDAGDGPACRS